MAHFSLTILKTRFLVAGFYWTQFYRQYLRFFSLSKCSSFLSAAVPPAADDLDLFRCFVGFGVFLFLSKLESIKLKEESIGKRRRFTQCDLSTFVTSKLALKARTPLQIQARTIITLKSLNSARHRIKNMWNFSNTFILSYKIISFLMLDRPHNYN